MTTEVVALPSTDAVVSSQALNEVQTYQSPALGEVFSLNPLFTFKFEGANTDGKLMGTFEPSTLAAKAPLARPISGALPSVKCALRGGLHTGEIEISRENVGGIAIPTAARVSALAGTGEILVSSTVRDLVAGSGLRFHDRGMHSLRGLPEPLRLFLAEP